MLEVAAVSMSCLTFLGSVEEGDGSALCGGLTVML